MFMRSITARMVSTGHGEPAMIPVRSELRSQRSGSRSSSSSSAMNIVGTPYSVVQRSSLTASRTATGSNASAGSTTLAPCEIAARLPITIPKQW